MWIHLFVFRIIWSMCITLKIKLLIINWRLLKLNNLHNTQLLGIKIQDQCVYFTNGNQCDKRIRIRSTVKLINNNNIANSIIINGTLKKSKHTYHWTNSNGTRNLSSIHSSFIFCYNIWFFPLAKVLITQRCWSPVLSQPQDVFSESRTRCSDENARHGTYCLV